MHHRGLVNLIEWLSLNSINKMDYTQATTVGVLSFNELFWDVRRTWKKRLKIALELVNLAQRYILANDKI